MNTMTKKQKRMYAAAKAVVTKQSNKQMIAALNDMRFFSLAALKAVKTRRMNKVNSMFGVK